MEPCERRTLTQNVELEMTDGCFLSTLYSITDRVIHDLHGCNLGSSEPTPCADMVSSIIQVGQQLSRWRALQPASMGIIEPDDLCHAEDDPKGWKFRVVLTLRFHNLRILAHRPILDRYLEKKGTIEQTPEDLSILSQFGHLGMTTCLQSAEKIISIVRVCTSSTGQQRGILGAWWFSLYYSQQLAANPCSEPQFANTRSFQRCSHCCRRHAVTGDGPLRPGPEAVRAAQRAACGHP